MKTLKYFFVAALAIVMTSCLGGASLAPESESIEGPLGEYFQVVKKDYKAEGGEVTIEIKRIKAGLPAPWEKSVEIGGDMGQYELKFIVEFEDADEEELSKKKTDIKKDLKELKALADIGVGETATLTFDCPEKAAKFKLSSESTMHGEIERTVNLEGNIGNYPVMMTMHIDPDGSVTGAYYYKKKGPGNYLYFKGSKSGDDISLNEFTIEGDNTGSFSGTFADNVFKGQFSTRGNIHDYLLKPTEMQEIDLSSVDFNSFSVHATSYYSDDYDDYDDYGDHDDDSYSSYSSADLDELLDSYEKYVDKYILFLKKAAKGDQNALMEYPALMQKAQDFAEKLGNVQGSLSSSQLRRYIEINNKMATAMQQMR